MTKLRKRITKQKPTKQKKQKQELEQTPESKEDIRIFEQIEYCPSKIVDFCQAKVSESNYILVARESKKIEILDYPGFNSKRILFFHKDLIIKNIYVVAKPIEVFDKSQKEKKITNSKSIQVEDWNEFELMVVFMNGICKTFDMLTGLESFSFDIAGYLKIKTFNNL
jgi:hypothetical protein